MCDGNGFRVDNFGLLLDGVCVCACVCAVRAFSTHFISLKGEAGR